MAAFKMIHILLLLVLLQLSSAKLPQLDGRIVGGIKADIVQFPYQLSFQYYGSHICGASILSDIWALTAAHCIITTDPTVFKVRAGSSYRSKGGQLFQISEITIHPDWNAVTMDADFALLKITGTFPLGSTGIERVGLPLATPSTADLTVVSGWGTTKEGASGAPKQLRYVVVPVLDWATCNTQYTSTGGITHKMICAAGFKQDSCQGDSGGPLINLITGKQVGVVSWGYGCARPSYPGVYADVFSVKAWILSTTGLPG